MGRTADFKTGYSSRAFAPPDELEKMFRDQLDGVEFDTMLSIGTSGDSVVPWIARLMGKHFAIVRKNGVSSHDYSKINGVIGERWIFVDDMIASGDTFSQVYREVHDKASFSKFVGAMLYEKPEFHPQTTHYAVSRIVKRVAEEDAALRSRLAESQEDLIKPRIKFENLDDDNEPFGATVPNPYAIF